MGHARALLSIEDPKKQLEVFRQVMEETLSVRKTEELAKQEKKEEPGNKKKVSSFPLSLTDKTLRSQISERFGVDVKFQRKDEEKGSITIPFSTEEELGKILKKMKV